MKAITLKEAKELKYRQELYHITLKNADGTPKRIRVNGEVQTWKRDPNRIRIPVKHGLYDTGCLTNGTYEGNRFTVYLDDVSLTDD